MEMTIAAEAELVPLNRIRVEAASPDSRSTDWRSTETSSSIFERNLEMAKY